MLSTLFPPDPTLTVENVRQVMEKVEPKQRLQVWRSLNVIDNITKEIWEKYSTDSEKETTCIDNYVNCCPHSSWEHIAKELYWHQEVASIEKVRSHLPPRGEPCF